ncbi:INCREASED PETAL GROWTH ANISOTROPY 1-like protein 1 isoform X1 [Rutidosis leptorrhynchoides]|uniref:INCREASED PETAL GROWTH ANISOTROPY 1-like protein 1 isoform X1 n=1 Tax=Rutidosis leptorrhynchoides TaxID=125765 RepID=UPI003A9A646C
MPAGGKDGTTISFLKRELEASLVKITSLEKENHELKQEMSRLKSQINTLKAHDLERKSMLWKKLQNSMDSVAAAAAGGKVVIDHHEPPQKSKLADDDVHDHNNNNAGATLMKKLTSNHNNNDNNNLIETATAIKAVLPRPPAPPLPPQRRVIAPAAAPPPPLPPPLPSSPVGSKVQIRRVPAVMEFYRSLMKRDTQKDNKNGGGLLGLVTYSRDMIGEIENRSTYLTSIKSDVEKYGELIEYLIKEVERAAFKDICEVEGFVKWVDAELSCLVDERAVLKHFPHWPERKADALREAAFTYRDLINLQSQVLAFQFKTTTNQPSSFIQSLQALQDRVESSINGVERTREGTSKKYKELQIPWQWLMDTGLVGQIKLASLKLARECMTRVSKELECSVDTSRDADLLLHGVRFAFRVHQEVLTRRRCTHLKN